MDGGAGAPDKQSQQLLVDQGGKSHRAARRASPPGRPPSMGGSSALPAEAEDTRAQKTVGPLNPGLRELGWCNRVSLTPSTGEAQGG